MSDDSVDDVADGDDVVDGVADAPNQDADPIITDGEA